MLPRSGVMLGATALLAGCVALSPEMLPVAHNPAGDLSRRFEDLGPGAHLEPSLRFLVKAYGPAKAKEVSAEAEKDFERVVAHTGLFSFRPGGLYPVTVYKDEEEYLAKTGQPGWSGGVAAGNAIYTYESPDLARTLAHEISHIVYQEYMGGPGKLRWFNEGLAVYEELQDAGPEDRAVIEGWMAQARADPMPFSRMVDYAPGEGGGVHLWYGQSASVASWLVEAGGRGGVAKFLELTKSGAGLDQALGQAFPTLCTDLESLEQRWRAAAR